MYHYYIRLNQLDTIAKLEEAIESLLNEPRNVVGSYKRWDSGLPTELLVSAQRKLEAMERKLDKLETKLEAKLKTGSWCYSEPDFAIDKDDKQTLRPWLIIADGFRTADEAYQFGENRSAEESEVYFLTHEAKAEKLRHGQSMDSIAKTNESYYQVAVYSGSTCCCWSLRHVLRDCGHKHRSEKAAEKCREKLIALNNGNCSADWYNAKVVEFDKATETEVVFDFDGNRSTAQERCNC